MILPNLALGLSVSLATGETAIRIELCYRCLIHFKLTRILLSSHGLIPPRIFTFCASTWSLSFAVVKPLGCFREPLFLILLPVLPARCCRRISGSAQPLPHSAEEDTAFGLLINSNVAASGYAYKPSSSGCELRKFNPALVGSGCWTMTRGCKRVSK